MRNRRIEKSAKYSEARSAPASAQTEKRVSGKSETAAPDGRRVALKIVLICATVLIAVLLSALIANLVRIGNLNAVRANLERETARYEQLTGENQSVIDEKTTDEHIEESAREDLGMAKEGEEIFVE